MQANPTETIVPTFRLVLKSCTTLDNDDLPMSLYSYICPDHPIWICNLTVKVGEMVRYPDAQSLALTCVVGSNFWLRSIPHAFHMARQTCLSCCLQTLELMSIDSPVSKALPARYRWQPEVVRYLVTPELSRLPACILSETKRIMGCIPNRHLSIMHMYIYIYTYVCILYRYIFIYTIYIHIYIYRFYFFFLCLFYFFYVAYLLVNLLYLFDLFDPFHLFYVFYLFLSLLFVVSLLSPTAFLFIYLAIYLTEPDPTFCYLILSYLFTNLSI